MLEVKNILVPVEIHENAAPVVTWAALMARAAGSRLTLLHVNEAVEPLKTRLAFQSGGYLEQTTVAQWRTQYEQTARAELERLAERLCAGVSVNTMLLEGRAHVAILGSLDTTACDLVVMGTHGRPWYQQVLLGSTAETVLRASPVPVLVVHNVVPTQRPPRLRRLLFPTDFSTAGRQGEEWVRYLVAHGAEEILLVHTVENPLLDVYDPDKAEIDLRRIMEDSRQHPPRSAKPFWDHAHQVAHARLSVLRQQLLGAPFRVSQAEVMVGEGPAAEDILKAAEQKSPDLIVMATHGRTGVRRLLLGSVTEKVVRAASCPVLAVPSRE
jgi:nucleotide-binding universal stress UspA family protein